MWVLDFASPPTGRSTKWRLRFSYYSHSLCCHGLLNSSSLTIEKLEETVKDFLKQWPSYEELQGHIFSFSPKLKIS